MRKKKIKILHVAQAAGGVDRYIRMLLKYLDLNKEKKRWKLILGDDILVDSYLRVLSVACIVGVFNITDKRYCCGRRCAFRT